MIESADEFYRLRTSRDPVEYGRAAHEEASLDVWREVIQRFPDMREWVAHNKTVPAEILETLAADADVRVRWTVAGKRKLSAALQERLAGDADEGVRRALAFNAKATHAVLERLANDPSPLVAERAQARLAQDADQPPDGAV
jgi:hypothetical protein